jgi:hypothetical protein
MPINIFGETGHIQAEIIHENIHKCTCLWKLWKLLASLSFFICFSRPEGVRELDVPVVVCPLRWFFFCLLQCGSFHFVPCIPPFFFSGALVYLWLAGFHHQHLLFHIHFGWNWNPNNYVQIDWIGCDYHLSKINSYYKMIIWFFCCKILPFLEIVLQKSLEKPVF